MNGATYSLRRVGDATWQVRFTHPQVPEACGTFLASSLAEADVLTAWLRAHDYAEIQ